MFSSRLSADLSVLAVSGGALSFALPVRSKKPRDWPDRDPPDRLDAGNYSPPLARFVDL